MSNMNEKVELDKNVINWNNPTYVKPSINLYK